MRVIQLVRSLTSNAPSRTPSADADEVERQHGDHHERSGDDQPRERGHAADSEHPALTPPPAHRRRPHPRPRKLRAVSARITAGMSRLTFTTS